MLRTTHYAIGIKPWSPLTDAGDLETAKQNFVRTIPAVSSDQKEAGRAGCLVLLLLLALFPAAYFFNKHERQQISGACEQRVTGALRAPSTAKFGEWTVVQQPQPNQKLWHVSGYVDAQNVYSAMLRSNVSCYVDTSAKGQPPQVTWYSDDSITGESKRGILLP